MSCGIRMAKENTEMSYKEPPLHLKESDTESKIEFMAN